MLIFLAKLWVNLGRNGEVGRTRFLSAGNYFFLAHLTIALVLFNSYKSCSYLVFSTVMRSPLFYTRSQYIHTMKCHSLSPLLPHLYAGSDLVSAAGYPSAWVRRPLRWNRRQRHRRVLLQRQPRDAGERDQRVQRQRDLVPADTHL